MADWELLQTIAAFYVPQEKNNTENILSQVKTTTLFARVSTIHRLANTVLVLASSILLASQTFAQVVAGVNPGDKTTQIPGLQLEADIDGVANEAIWAQAALIEDCHQYNPQGFVEPSEPTSVRIYYTEDALFITARMEESDTSNITAQVLRQGQGLGADDIFALILDPYLDRRNGYRFELNANGVRWDGL